MKDELTIDMLTKDSVSIKKQKCTTVEGVEYPIGEPWRKAYANSISGRLDMAKEVAEPYLTAILSVWGNVPTIAQTE